MGFRSCLFLLCLAGLSVAGKYSTVVRAFEDTPEYVAPVAPLLNTLTNSGWHRRAAIGKSRRFVFSVPLTIAGISDRDRQYRGTYKNAAYLEHVGTAADHDLALQHYTTPTVFGRESAPTLKRLDIGYIDFENNELGVIDTTDILLSDGVTGISRFNWLPMGALQVDFSAWHTAIKMRYAGFFIPDELRISMPAVSLSHDVQWYKKTPFHFTLFTNSAFHMVDWVPGADVRGTAEIRGYSGFSGFLWGREYAEGRLSFFVETGIEYSRLRTGGRLQIRDGDEWDLVEPSLSFSGRRSFKAGVFVTVSPKDHAYAAQAGGSAGAQNSFSLTPVLFESSN
jgi:hypothetical protein